MLMEDSFIVWRRVEPWSLINFDRGEIMSCAPISGCIWDGFNERYFASLKVDMFKNFNDDPRAVLVITDPCFWYRRYTKA